MMKYGANHRVGNTLTESFARRLSLTRPVDLRLTLGPLRRGPSDPCFRSQGQEVLRATRTPDGPATIHLWLEPAADAVYAEAWGSGASWALEALPQLVGAHDDDSALLAMFSSAPTPTNTLLKDLHKQFRGLRITRTMAVTETVVPVVLEQKVAGVAAHRSYREMVRALGEPAPGPSTLAEGLMVPPSPAVLAATAYWAFHPFGIERKRADTIRMVCAHASRLETLLDLPSVQAQAALMSLPGVGPWSAAEVALIALGDPDAVSVGDYHLPHQVAWALAGLSRGTDELMLTLLEPYKGQRGRVLRLIEASGLHPPRRGPGCRYGPSAPTDTGGHSS